MEMNSTIETQLDHRTIRKFTAEPISAETLAALQAAVNRTPSSQGLQHSSMIRVTDKEIAAQIAQVCTQDYVAQAPELWIFIVDTRRARRISQENGVSGMAASSYDAFTAAFTDACLMAQNLVVAAESLGLGTCFLGSIQNDTRRLIEILGLPKLTYPVLGVIFGHPAEEPEVKPRMAAELRMMENQYTEPESWTQALAAYDEQVKDWVDTRYGKKVGPFTETVASRMEHIAARRAENAQIILEQGFEFLPAGN
ncbi:nitroreductase family protein [Actinobaculum suis]|uniref:nitroreductase family protein n=1 Tax=Actinobaculum suis TaxID=1657 RepID=UPI00066FFECC|nr:nitroreductase family protein [Actinobaculum suis]